MVDHGKAAPSPCNCRVRPRDYPQGKQRKETGLAGKRGELAHLGTLAPAGASPGTPRHAGIRAKKKGLETIQALLIGGGGRRRTAVRRHSIPGPPCLARRWISSPGSTACEARPGTSL